jgi:cell division protein FtsN
MARDYKNPSRTPAKRKSAAGTPAPLWFLAGLTLGVGGAVAVHLYHVHLGPKLMPVAAVTAPAADSKPPAADSRARDFDFYRILPEMEVVVPAEEERALTARPAPQPTAPAAGSEPAPAASKERYLLQVASFQNIADADRLKAQLALLGLEASIQTVEIRGGQTWHRVRVGPFSNRNEIADVRQRLQANGIQAVLLKLSG